MSLFFIFGVGKARKCHWEASMKQHFPPSCLEFVMTPRFTVTISSTELSASLQVPSAAAEGFSLKPIVFSVHLPWLRAPLGTYLRTPTRTGVRDGIRFVPRTPSWPSLSGLPGYALALLKAARFVKPKPVLHQSNRCFSSSSDLCWGCSALKL